MNEKTDCPETESCGTCLYMRCACGMPNTVSYNPAKNHYEPVGMVGARKSKSPKKKKGFSL